MRASTPTRLKDQGRRPDIETELNDHYHVAWTYLSDVPTAQFDIDRSLQNQARFEAINEDTVEQYREGVERGDPFPAVIAFRPRKNGRLHIIDGNHRLVAHDRAGRPLEVYEIAQGTKPQTIALMTFSFNTRHGRPTTEDERISQALYLMENGATIAGAAEAVNLLERVLKRAVAKANADKRAVEVEANMREWEALTQAGRSRLLNISTDEGFKEAIHLAFAAGLDSDEIFQLTSLLNSSKSATKQRAIVKQQTELYQDRIQDSAGGALNAKTARKPMSPKQRVGMMMGQVLALPDDVAGIARAYAENERHDVATQLLGASEKIRKIALAIDDSVA